MKYILIQAANDQEFKKGDRILVQVNDEAFLATVTGVRSGQIYLQFDDGDTGKVSVGSKRILGRGVDKQIKKSIPLNNTKKYLIDNKKDNDDIASITEESIEFSSPLHKEIYEAAMKSLKRLGTHVKSKEAGKLLPNNDRYVSFNIKEDNVEKLVQDLKKVTKVRKTKKGKYKKNDEYILADYKGELLIYIDEPKKSNGTYVYEGRLII